MPAIWSSSPPGMGRKSKRSDDPESLDITKAIPELDMPEILSYGRQHGVGLSPSSGSTS